MFRLSRDGCTSLSVASILTRPFTILYIKTSLALCLFLACFLQNALSFTYICRLHIFFARQSRAYSLQPTWIGLTTRIFLLNKHFRIIITVFNAQFYPEGLKAYTTLQEYIQIKQRTQVK
jgi:hypothetical protein